MIAAAALTLAIVTQDQASLRAAPRDSAVQQAALWQGDTLEIRGQRMDYLQVYDHRRERAGFIHTSQVRVLSLKPADAPELKSVMRFLRDTPGAEALGIGFTAAYLKAAPAADIGADAFDILGTLAERLARRASLKHPKAVSDTLSAHMEVAAFYGVVIDGYERDGAMQLCYNGEAFRRVLALPSNSVERAKAALALTRHECMSADMHPQNRLAHDQWRAEVLDKVTSTHVADLPDITKNRLLLRRAGVQASLAFQLARRAQPASVVAASASALQALAAVNKLELTDADQQEYSEAAIRVGASRWAAEPEVVLLKTTDAQAAAKAATQPRLVIEPGQAGETCVLLFDKPVDDKARPAPAFKRCTYAVVWAASVSYHPNGQAVALAVQPLDTWRELWVLRKTDGQWTLDILPPASSNPELGYVEFAGWVPNAPQMLVARETRLVGRTRRSFELVRMDTLATEKQASEASLLQAFARYPDARWKRQTVSLR
jgi:hypothetical protein